MGAARAVAKFVTNIDSTLILGEAALVKSTKLLATKILALRRCVLGGEVE